MRKSLVFARSRQTHLSQQRKDVTNCNSTATLRSNGWTLRLPTLTLRFVTQTWTHFAIDDSVICEALSFHWVTSGIAAIQRLGRVAVLRFAAASTNINRISQAHPSRENS